ncbi:MAG: Lar family restriction alleviation protein [Rhizobiales bacterium]|nr:Lar family restriction alleviation protein [Hyphomicrobiales bacterium]
MTDNLAPCPFCGREAEQDFQQAYRAMQTGRIDHGAAVFCTGCNANMIMCRGDHPELSDEERMAVIVDDWNRRTPPPSTHMRGDLWDHLVVLSGYHITRPPTPDNEFVQVCNGDLRKMVELMGRTDQPATSVEEFYEGDEVAYLRDTLKEVTKERDHFHNQWRACWAPLTPRSENEKQGFERVLAILKSKLSDGGGIVGPSEVQRAHNDFYRGRRVAFEECATMLRAALATTEGKP